jgi:hypothetical protein
MDTVRIQSAMSFESYLNSVEEELISGQMKTHWFERPFAKTVLCDTPNNTRCLVKEYVTQRDVSYLFYLYTSCSRALA